MNPVNPVLIRNGLPFIEKYIELIEAAKHHIFLHTYIFELDEVTGPIISALNAKAQEGVKVFILFDSVGSNMLSDQSVEFLRKQAFHFDFFFPLFSYHNFGRRLHQKLLLVDAKQAILGGINLGKRMNFPQEGSPWLDYACHIKIETAHNLFLKTIPLYIKKFPKQSEDLYQIRRSHGKKQNKSDCKLLVNDWTRYKNQIYKEYIKNIKNAKKSIYIMATYFVPGKRLLRELSLASARGVEVNLIFSKNSDVPLGNQVERYFFGWYIQKGINLYEWDHSIIHGKLALIDDKWCTVGSYNHNYISHFLNIELNLSTSNHNLIQEINSEFQEILKGSKMIDKKRYQEKFGFFNKFFNTMTFILASVITLLSTIMMLKRRKEK